MRLRVCIGVLLLVLVDAAAQANPAWVEGISVLYEKPTSAAFHVHLANRFQLAAVEVNAGKRCAVRLQPGATSTGQERFSVDTLLWEPTVTLPLQRVSSEWVGDQLWLQLFFEEGVICTFQVSTDRRSVWVSIKRADDAATKAIREQLERARDALIRNDVATAISVYRSIVEGPRHPLQQDALEYLGVALERQQDYARAAKIYQAYLTEFPDSTGANRVRQRLEGLQLMTREPTQPLRATRTRDVESMRWFGVISGGYQQYSSDQGVGEWDDLQSVGFTDINLNGRYRDEQLDAKLLVSAGYSQDFAEDLDNPERLSSLYADVLLKKSDQQVRLGRQSTSGEGVLGKFDGVRYSKGIGQQWRVNGLLGYPVLSSHDVEVNTDSSLYGTSIDFTPLNTSWQTNAFYLQQETGGFIDRQAVGFEINYLAKEQSWLGYVDYDLHFGELNTAMLNVNWFGAEDSHYYVSLDYRRSPVLTVSNALIGQLVGLEELAQSGLTQSELDEIALDRTAVSQSLAGGASRRFAEHWRWAIDVNAWELSGTDESFGVPGFDGTDVESSLSLQLMGNDLWWERDLSWYTLRYARLSASDLVAATAETRIPVGERWRIRPRLQVYQRTFTLSDGREQSVQPQIRVEYFPDKSWLFELDVGSEILSVEQNGVTVDRTDYLIYLRADWLF